METRSTEDAKQIELRACAEASAWIVRLHGPHRDRRLEAGFRDWLAAHPENSRQFEIVTQVWDAAATPVPGIPRLAPDDHEEAAHPRSRWLFAAAVAFIVVVVGVWGANTFWLNPSYSTGIGEQRVVRLSDGSRMTLNAASEAQVSYRRGERRINVERGEAFFEVAKDSGRPFRVRAGDHVVEALGTSFVVRRDAKQFSVTLVEGKIAVSSPDEDVLPKEMRKRATDQPQPVTLQPGQRLRVGTVNPKPEIDAPRMDVVTAWRRGEVMLEKTALADAVAEMNRYDQRRLVIDDAHLAGVRVSGIYHTGDSLLFAQMLSRLYGFEVVEQDGEIHLKADEGRVVSAE